MIPLTNIYMTSHSLGFVKIERPNNLKVIER
jgi:hypothetical protein